MLYKSNENRKGKVVILLAVSLTAIFGLLSITIDGGLLQDKRRHVQATADAAALAAATDLFKNYPVLKGVDVYGTAKQSAQAVTADNGYNADSPELVVNIPPQSGDHAGKAGYAEIILEYKQKSYFSSVMGHTQIPVRARAVARGRWEKENNGIIVLDPKAKGALNAHGNGNLNVQGANVIVNSDHVEAGIGTGGAILKSAIFDIKGGINDPAPFDGQVNTGVPPAPDPLRNLPPPDPNQMTVQSKNKFHKSNGNHFLQPGVYDGGISISGKASITLAAGIYYMKGGGFTFKGQGDLNGTEVMIYNAPEGSNDRMYIAGQGEVSITPPSTGIYKGVAFFQDRSADVNGNVQGNGLYNIRGTFYAAGALVQVDGNGDVSIGAQYISRMLDIGGNGDVNITWDSSVSAPLRQLHLVE